MNFNYLTMGKDCSPAQALRNLELRKFALPFDWIECSINNLQKCFQTNFKNFHKNLFFNKYKTRLIDHYGFQFPHDYPLINIDYNEDYIGEGKFAEQKNKFIVDNWKDYHKIVLNKYNRRIERFKNIINDKKIIIVLCRYSTSDVLKLKELFKIYYKITNIYFVNSSNQVFENDHIVNINTEKNNIWNDVNIWNTGINNIIEKIKIF